MTELKGSLNGHPRFSQRIDNPVTGSMRPSPRPGVVGVGPTEDARSGQARQHALVASAAIQAEEFGKRRTAVQSAVSLSQALVNAEPGAIG